MPEVDARTTATRLFDALAEVDRLRSFVEQVAQLDDPEAEPAGVQLMSRRQLADAAREVLR